MSRSVRTRDEPSGHERSPPDTAFPSPVRARPSPSSRACRDKGGQRRAIRPVRAPRMPMAHPVRAARAHPRVASAHAAAALTDCSSPLASPAGGQGTARYRPSKPESEVIFVVLSVRSRGGMSTHVSPAMWQGILFLNDGAALLLCLTVLACKRACWPLVALLIVPRLRLPACCVCRLLCASAHAC